ncbi:MAG: gliding motility-associated C-terminal domain-containing protein [Saprospiraceae bacterium]|nr:gliding motility-associated C-terminal domain-containing protein [Saprospiraceae bacterium]
MRLFQKKFSKAFSLRFSLIFGLIIWASSLFSQQDTCVRIEITAKSGQKGDTICVELRVFNFKDISAFQFGIQYDPTILKPISKQNFYPGLDGWDQTGVFFDGLRDVVRSVWTNPNTVNSSLPDSTVLYELCFLIIGNPGECSPLGFHKTIPTLEFSRETPNGSEVVCFEDPNPDDQVKVDFPPGLTVVSNACGTLTNTGSVIIKAWGGQSPYTVSSNAPNGNGNIVVSGDMLMINNLPPGNYDFTVADASGKDTMFVVQVLNAPPITISNNFNYTRDPTCYNRADGRIGFTVSGGVGSRKIIWTPNNIFGSTQEPRLLAGKYTITVIDSFGCKTQQDFILRADTLFSDITIDKNASCVGNCDGQVTVRARGGTPFLGQRYNFYWSQAVSRNCLPDTVCRNDSLCGQQFVIVADRNRVTGGEACRDTIFFNIPYSGEMTDSVIVDSVRCFGEANGQIQVFIQSKGSLQFPLNFTLRNSTLNQIPGGSINGNHYTSPGISAGIYYLSVVDSLGCTFEDTIEVFQPFQLEIVELQIDTIESCSPGGDAFIEVRGLGGTPAYQYQWDYQNSTATRLNNLGQGVYTLTLTDAKGCTAIKSYTISQPMGPVITGFNAVDVICPGDTSGCIEVLVSPGSNNNIRYRWSTGDTTRQICNLPSGLYSVTITDDNGCSVIGMDSIRFTGSAIRIDSVVLFHPSCPGKADGLIIVFASGGSGLLSYSWDNAVNAQVNASITAGNYIVTIDDVGGCPALVDTITLIDPPKPLVSLSNFQKPSCANTASCDGSATVTVNTLDTLVTITWSSGEQFLFNSNAGTFTSTAVQLCEGAQYVIVTVNNLCSDTLYFNLPAATPIRIDSSKIALIPPSCFGRTDGSITIDAIGGTSPYRFQWLNGGPSSSVISGIGDGYYTVQITDSLGCIHTDSIRLRQPDTIRIQIIQGSSLDVSCPGANDGRITLVWNGGNRSKAQFNWSPNVGQDSVLTNLSAGTYTVTVTDGNGCTGTTSHTVLAPAPFVYNLTPIDTPHCANEQIDFSVLSVMGANGPTYRFTIQGGAPQRIGDMVPLFPGNYLISIFDNNGCQTDTNIVIPNPVFFLSVDFGSDQETIFLGDSILLDGNVNTAVPLRTISWSPVGPVSTPNSTSSFVRPTSNTTFTLTVTDENGCTDFDVITIIVEDIRRVFVNNAMSPNGDGINEFLEITTGPEVREIEFVEVYDRWGGRMYRIDQPDISAGITATWDGTFKKEPVMPGVYVYQISIVFADGYRLVYRGDVTVVR